MKKIISVIMAMSLAICALPAMSVSAAENTDEIKGVKYGFRITQSQYGSSAALQSIEGNSKNVVLPDYVTAKGDKYKIASIDVKALQNNGSFETFKLNSFCLDIGDYVFSGCKNLKSITFNSVIRNIGMGAFESTGLESVALSPLISNVGASAFSGCRNLKSFTAGFGLASIGEYAFYNCPSLTKVGLNAGLTKIGQKAFGYSGTEKNQNLSFRVARNSTGQKYAQDNGFPYKYDLSSAIVGYLKDKKYTGKPITQTINVSDRAQPLKPGVDYRVSFSNNIKPGFAKVTVTGIGKYEGALQQTFFIKPIVAQMKKPKATVKKRRMTVKWKKQKGISGYQIAYAAKKSFRGKKTVTAKKSASSKRINKKLKKGKYYVKIRSYKTISGRRTYGAYSRAIMKKVR